MNKFIVIEFATDNTFYDRTEITANTFMEVFEQMFPDDDYELAIRLKQISIEENVLDYWVKDYYKNLNNRTLIIKVI